jgi:glutathione S-transferase
MKLHSTITSAYTRKVWIVAHEAGMAPRIERIATNPHTDEYLRRDNPLCRIPTLVLDDGEALFDSPVICEYLDSLSVHPKLFPLAGAPRWLALKLQALGDGILDANTARRSELMRPQAMRSMEMIAHRVLSVRASYLWLEDNIDKMRLDNITIGEISIGCALGYSAFAFPADRIDVDYPALAAWHDKIECRPSFRATRYEVLKDSLPAHLIKVGPAAKPLEDSPPHHPASAS